VVFVGVTAGFLFDSFREDRSDRKLEQKYLENLHQNLHSDSTELHTSIANNRNNVDISEKVVSAMQRGSLSPDSALMVIQVMASYYNLNLNDATYQSMVNSGSLGLISDFELKEQMVNYYQAQEDMRYVEGVYNEYISNYVIPHVFSFMDFVTGEADTGFDVNNREFRNITSGYYVLARQQIEMMESLDSLRLELKKEVAAAKDVLQGIPDPAMQQEGDGNGIAKYRLHADAQGKHPPIRHFQLVARSQYQSQHRSRAIIENMHSRSGLHVQSFVDQFLETSRRCWSSIRSGTGCLNR
jgi:hypothetical protein